MNLSSFKRLVLAHYRSMYRVAYAILRDSDDSQDAVQDAVTRLWEKRHELTDISDHEAFCITAVKRRCIDMLRQRQRTMEEMPTSLEHLEDGTDTAQAIESRDTLARVNELMDALPEQQREVLRLRSWGGCSVQEIAEITGLSCDNARKVLSRARQKLKELYNRKK